MFINNNSVNALEVEDDVYKGNNSDHIWCSLLYGSENILCGYIYRPPLSNRVDGDTEILASLTSESKSKYDGLDLILMYVRINYYITKTFVIK